MPDIPHIRIKHEGTSAQVFMDGKKIEGIRRISYEFESKNMVPVLKLDLLAADMEIDARLIPELPEIFKPFYKVIEPSEDGSE